MMVLANRVAIFAATLLPVTAVAQDRSYAFGNGYSFDPYGQLAPAYQSFDDGKEVTTNITDMSTATSRLGFYLRTPGILSFQFETGIGFRPSQDISQNNTPEAWDWNKDFLRKAQVILDTGIGRFFIGQGSMPSDGIAESDFGGSVVVAKSTIKEGWGSYLFRNTTNDLSAITIKDTFDNFDGPRLGRLRYDSPKLGGLTLSAAYGIDILKDDDDKDYYDLALRYEGTFRNLEVKSAIGVSYVDDGDDTTSTVAGSASLLDLETGLNLQVAAGVGDENQGKYVYIKPGWIANFWSAGETRFVIEYFHGSDYVTDGSRSRMYGAAVVQVLDEGNLELYAGYRKFTYDDAADYHDAEGVQIGALYRF